jgi:hypothetical protein
MAKTDGCFKGLSATSIAFACYLKPYYLRSRAASVGKPHNQSANRIRCVRHSGFLEAVSDPVQGFDHLEFVVHDLELLA